MRLFMIEPEVAGEIGENTIYQNYDAIINEGAKPIITHLHFVFEGWLGDDILEVTPCFLVSERLKNLMEEKQLKGCEFQGVEISLSDNFLEMYPDREIPQFFRLLPQGTISIDGETYTNWSNMDFSISEKSYLVLSEKAKDIISSCHLDYADICELFPKL